MAGNLKIFMTLKAIDKASSTLNKIKLAAVAVGVAVVAASVKAISLASDFEETQSKFSVVFSSLKAESEAAAKKLEDDFGLSGLAAKKLLSDTGDLLSGFGFTQQAALDLSIEVNELAVDLASFTNIEGGTEKASVALTKALLGESEQVKALGIVIRQDSEEYIELVKQYMEAEGASLLQAKALTAITIATKQSKNAIGDFARTQESFANQQRLLTKEVVNLGVVFGTFLLPTATAVISEMTTLAGKMNDLANKEESAAFAASIIVKTFQAIIASGLGVIATFDIVGTALAAFGALAQLRLGAAKIGWEELTKSVTKHGDRLRALADEVFDFESAKAQIVGESEISKQDAIQATMDIEQSAQNQRSKTLAAETAAIETALNVRVKKWTDNTNIQIALEEGVSVSFNKAILAMGTSWENFGDSFKAGAAAMADVIRTSVVASAAEFIAAQATQAIAGAMKWIFATIPPPFSFVAAASAVGAVGALFHNIQFLAAGGVASGLVMAGESGRELINVGSPSRIISNAQTESLLGGGRNISLTFTGNTIIGEDSLEDFADMVIDKVSDTLRMEKNIN